MEKNSHTVFMEQAQEYESVILVEPLQFNEGFNVLTYTASLSPHSNQLSSLSKMATLLTLI